MKWTKMYGAVVAMLGMVASAEAGSIVLTSHSCCGAEKSCGCAPACQPKCCRPVIQADLSQIYNYQRSARNPRAAAPAPAAAAAKCAAPARSARCSLLRLVPRRCPLQSARCSQPRPVPQVLPGPATCAAPVPRLVPRAVRCSGSRDLRGSGCCLCTGSGHVCGSLCAQVRSGSGHVRCSLCSGSGEVLRHRLQHQVLQCRSLRSCTLDL